MIDLADRLTKETDHVLQSRRRNAMRLATLQPDTPRGSEAAHHLALIEAEFDRRSLPGMIAGFLEKFPAGFDDEKHNDQERRYKLEASGFCRNALSPQAFDVMAAGGPTDELLADVRKLVGMTNLIQGSFEKPKLLDKISDPLNTRVFLTALGELLHADAEPEIRLGRFAETLQTLDLLKWTYATYFLFLAEPDRCMFVKPTGLTLAIEITRYPFEYAAVPSAKLYAEVLTFAEWLRQKLIQQGRPELLPKDMIDVQSFIWHLAPTGKHAR